MMGDPDGSLGRAMLESGQDDDIRELKRRITELERQIELISRALETVQKIKCNHSVAPYDPSKHAFVCQRCGEEFKTDWRPK